MFEWLRGGNDKHLAETKYSGRESATDRAARKRRERHQAAGTDTYRAGQAWEDSERQRERGRRTR